MVPSSWVYGVLASILMVSLLATEGPVANASASPSEVSSPAGSSEYLDPLSDLSTDPPSDEREDAGSEVTPLIVGGSYVDITKYPWQVALVSLPNTNTFQKQFCAGTIIAKNWIMTAAHCVEGVAKNKVGVIAGITTLPRKKLPVSAVSQIIIHPSYNSATLNNDIALIQLSKPLKFDKKRNAIALPKVNYSSGSVWATGWGRTDTFDGNSYSTRLKHVQMTLRSHSWCEIDYPGDYVRTTMMCADDWPGLESSCNGDSGGGLVGKANGKWVVVGITSWGTVHCGLATSVYTRVSNYAGWIKSKTGIKATG